MKKLFQVPAAIQGISTLKDKTMKMTVYVSSEISPEEKATIFDLEQKEGWMVFSPNEVQASDVPEEKAEFKGKDKSLSERLYNVLYVYHSQNFSGDFQEWRKKEMERLIVAYKEKLQ